MTMPLSEQSYFWTSTKAVVKSGPSYATKVSAMLFNRKEFITFNKLKPAVQELLRHNFTLDHLAQIKTIYPDAYTYHQEKRRNFGSTSKEKYELVLTPIIEAISGRNTPDADNILKTVSQNSMGPKILLERKRIFYNTLLDRVKNEHQTFLLNLGSPMNIPKEKIMRWHPEFSVETCRAIEKAELPQPPQVEKTTAKDVLDKAKSLFNCGTRMEKALQRLAEANMTSKSTSSSSTQDFISQTTRTNIQKINIVDTPPATPTTQSSSYLGTTFKGIPKALLEKVRAKQAAKALEEMTRTPTADKVVAMYSRFPELAKILRNIFVAEKKGVLILEAVIQKLDNSYRIKLMPQEMEEHIRLLCKLLPTWVNMHNVRNINYLKLDRNAEIAKVIERLESLAYNKVNKT